jgi:hypothetical protein
MSQKINPIPRMAAAIAYSDLHGERNGYKDAADLWGDMDDYVRSAYCSMARAALEAYNSV